ncbi:Arm DNA-binding domain-containing protein [Bradyrhizobium sp.]|jgi:hypothetical protein|uniref:Arm DNA-binding domain-containing protein n=1 Tax=Bradyrhizobium sp. TaxID=376 RepID=UPI003BAE53EA
MGKLNPKQIENLPPGTHGDGNNLYVVVKDTGARSYLLRYQWQGRSEKMDQRSTDRPVPAEASAARWNSEDLNPCDRCRAMA